MPLKTMPLDEPGINLTSMLDVVMFLIIFFMLGTQFVTVERKYEIQLPTAAVATPLTGRPDEIIVNIEANGLISVRNENLTLAQLEERLRAAREKFPGQGVLIRGDGRGMYQPVVDVLSVCRTAGIREISLANQPGGATP